MNIRQILTDLRRAFTRSPEGGNLKSDLQIRAEKAAERFTQTARKPVVIEFAGVPKAGKTSTITQVQAFLKRCGFRTEVVMERASVCPIRDKKHANFNVWTACTTLAQILEKTQDPPRDDDPHILILDRGIFDSICWMTMMERLSRLRRHDREIVEQFLRADEWRKRISAVVVMIASPEDAMKREEGVLPVREGRGHSIMNREVLQKIRETILECSDRLKDEFRINTVDTSSGATKDSPRRTAEHVVDLVLNVIEEQVVEDILYLPKARVKALFGEQRSSLDADKARDLASLFAEEGEFRSRESVEADAGLVQALPIVVVRNSSAAVLRLRRRERSSENPLNQKLVIWAGGHVRREDALEGEALLQCAMRELSEELRLNVEPGSLRIIGAVFTDVGGSASKHVGIAYEWRAETDDVAVALSSAEFFERRGTALSGTFVSLEALSQDVESGRITEPWSVELVRECLAKGSFSFSPRLL